MDNVVIHVNSADQSELTFAITETDIRGGEGHIFYPSLSKAERIAELYNSMTDEERSLYNQCLKTIYLDGRAGDINLYLHLLDEIRQAK